MDCSNTMNNLYSVYLFPIEEVAVDPLLAPVLFSALRDRSRTLACLLCNCRCGIGYRFAPHIVVGHDETTSTTNFMSFICLDCADAHDRDELQAMVFTAIKKGIMPDAILLNNHGHA